MIEFQGIAFKKGTENHGILYEAQVMTYLAAKLGNDVTVADFDMITIPDNIDCFEDILLRVTYTNKETAMYVIQIKHSKKTLQIADIIKKKSEYKNNCLIDLTKYFRSFQNIRKTVTDSDPTNGPLDRFLRSVKFENYYFCILTTSKETENKSKLSDIDICFNRKLKLLDIAEHEKYHQLDTSVFLAEKYEEFPEKLFIFLNQPNYTDMTVRLTETIDVVKHFTQPMAHNLYNLMAENSVNTKDYVCSPVNKEKFIQLCVQVILCNGVSIYMLKTKPIDENFIEAWHKICLRYQFITIDEKRAEALLPLLAAYYEYHIRKYTRKALEDVLMEAQESKEDGIPLESHQFTSNDCQQNCFQLSYFLRKALKNMEINTSNVVDLLLELWKLNEIPIIVDKSMSNIIKNLSSSNMKHRFFIISPDNISSEDRNNTLKTFNNLWFLQSGPAKDIFEEIMSIEVSLQGREPVPLKYILRDNKKSLKLISSSDLLSWVAKDSTERNIGIPLKSTVENYINRKFCILTPANTNEVINEDDIVKRLKMYKLMIISNDSGMGKSTVLTSLARKYDPTNYTILFDLAHCKMDLQDFKNIIHTNPIRYFYNKMQTKENALVEGILEQHLDQKNLVVFLDSFDEILPLHRDSVLNIIKTILATGVQVFVTSRTQAEDLLLNFHSVASKYIINLTYLDSKDITDYLRAFNVPNDVWRTLPETFLSIPLHLNLLNQIYRTSTGSHAKTMNATTLYKTFIDNKISIFYEKKKIVEECTRDVLSQLDHDILNNHYVIALVYLFGFEKIKDLEIVTNEKWNQMVHTFDEYKMSLGLVSRIDPIKFIHKTFAEYLVADYINSNSTLTIQLYRDVVTNTDLCQTYKFLHEIRSLDVYEETIETHITTGNRKNVLDIVNASSTWNKKHQTWGMHPVHWAAVSCRIANISGIENLKSFEILEIILEQTSRQTTHDVNVKDDYLGWNWLNILTGHDSDNYNFYKHLIKCLKIITNSNVYLKARIEENINMRYIGNDGFTLSHIAARNCDNDILDYLINSTSEFNYSYTDKFGSNILHHACFGGNLEIVSKLLDAEMRLTRYDNNLQNFLHHACGGGSSVETVKRLLDAESAKHIHAKDLEGRNIFHLACAGEKSDAKQIVDLLIARKLIRNIYVKDKNGWDALHHACSKGNREIVETLLNQGFNVNQKNNYGWTPFHLACSSNNTNLVQYLLKKKADFNVTIGYSQSTALHEACIVGNLDMVNMLLKRCCRLDKSDTTGLSAMHYASLGGNAQIIDVLINKGMQLNDQDDKQRTPLHYACYKGHHLSAMFLLDKGANSSALDIYDRNSLHYACMSGNSSIVRLLLRNKMKINVDQKDNEGRTPLHYAAENNDIDALSQLLQRRANPRVTDDKCHTPQHIAYAKGHFKAVKLLMEAETDLEQNNSEIMDTRESLREEQNIKTRKRNRDLKPPRYVSCAGELDSEKFKIYPANYRRCAVSIEPQKLGNASSQNGQ